MSSNVDTDIPVSNVGDTSSEEIKNSSNLIAVFTPKPHLATFNVSYATYVGCNSLLSDNYILTDVCRLIEEISNVWR